MAKCINCGKEISQFATKCKYCYTEQLVRVDQDRILISSTPNFEGFEIIEYYGWIYGEVVVPNGLLGALTAGTFFTVEALDKARSMAVDVLKEKARHMGANAIISIDVDISDLNGRGVLVSANGTAVYIIRNGLGEYEQILQEEQIKKEQQRQEKINEIVNSESLDNRISDFFLMCSSIEKYLDIEKLWDDMHFNEEKKYEELDKVIREKAYVERMYGSRVDEVKERLAKWESGDWS